MRDRLPVHIENRELPVDQFREKTREKKYSYGYVNVLYLASIIITAISVLSLVILRK